MKTQFADPAAEAYRHRFQPIDAWEDDAVLRLVRSRWAQDEKLRGANRDRMAERFLNRQSAALETLAAMKRNREAAR